ncbi:MAG: glycosyltransferase, partial [Bacteroidetes bacterium]|nr:glycosyltransferase [Bacteroidota bacterium]
MKKRILFLENSESNRPTGGSHKSLYILLNGLDRTKYEPFLLLNQKNQYLQLFDSLNILLFFLDHQKWNTRTIPSTNNGNGNNKNQPQQRKSIKSLFGVLFRVIIELVPMTVKTMGFIRRLHIDIIHTNTRIGSNQHGILAGWLTGIPVISHERWWTPDTWLNRRLIEVPKVIICVSDAIKSNILEIGSVESKCRVI